MKNTLILLLLILTAAFTKAGEKQSGKIYSKKGEVLNVDINVYVEGIILTASKITYYSDRQKHKISLSEIEHIEIGTKTYKIISYEKEVRTGPNSGHKTYTILAELVTNGSVKLYRAYYLQSNGYSNGGVYYSTGVSLAKDYYFVQGKIVKWVSKLDFKKSIKTFFPNCDLVDKVKNKTYRYRDIKEAVQYGNENCTISK